MKIKQISKELDEIENVISSITDLFNKKTKIEDLVKIQQELMELTDKLNRFKKIVSKKKETLGI